MEASLVLRACLLRVIEFPTSRDVNANTKRPYDGHMILKELVYGLSWASP